MPETNGRAVTVSTISSIANTIVLILGVTIGGWQLATWKGEITLQVTHLTKLVEVGLKTAMDDRVNIIRQVNDLQLWRAGLPKHVLPASDILERLLALDKRIDHLEDQHLGPGAGEK